MRNPARRVAGLGALGFARTGEPRLEKDPNRRVQEAIRLVFRKFQEVGTVRQTLLWFLEEGLQLPVLPVRKRNRLEASDLCHGVSDPHPSGVRRRYAYGKTEMVSRYDKGLPRKGCRRRPPDRWLALIPNTHEGYVDWETFQQIRRAIAENLPGPGRSGAAKRGLALPGRPLALSALWPKVSGTLHGPPP